MISPLAYVDASAKLGANVTVHPFAYVVLSKRGCKEPYQPSP